MPAFQDFGPLSERRKAERQQKKRKRIIIAATSVVVLLLVAAIGFVAAIQYNKQGEAHHNSGGKGGDSSASASKSGNSSGHSAPASGGGGGGSGGGLATASKMVEAICSSTDYKPACETAMRKAAGSPDHHPKDLVKAAITAISDELGKALDHSKLLKSEDPKVKGAIEDCKELFGHAKDELQRTVHIVDAGDVAQIAKKSAELKNWLSAVISYQQTCVDGIPEAEKGKMEDAVKNAKELTSNALAIVSQAATIFSALDLKNALSLRRLMSLEDRARAEGEGEGAAVDADGMPSWVEEGERRVLKEKDAKKLKPNAVVAQDGSGNFKTITEALAAMPKKHEGRYVIYVKAGTYDESPIVTKDMVNLTMYGDGSRKTVVTGSKNFVDGTRTFQTATFAAIGEGFMAIAMGFRNTAGAIKHQAVALRVQSDRAIFLNCRMEGYQDTLYAQTHRQYYRSCVITGTVDFIFGDAAAVFQNCVLQVRRPLDNQQNIVTAQGRIDKRETTGFVIQSCQIEPDTDLAPVKAQFRSYLGRPWKEYSRTIIMESTIGDFIHPDGYMPWEGEFALKTLTYGEYGNKGPGADVAKRVAWPGFKVIKRDEAVQYTVENFIQGAEWLKESGTPVKLGLFS